MSGFFIGQAIMEAVHPKKGYGKLRLKVNETKSAVATRRSLPVPGG